MGALWSKIIDLCNLIHICQDTFLGGPYKYPSEIQLSPGCRPRFTGEWIPSLAYPLNVDEAQGAMIGQDLVLVGGYLLDYDHVTTQVWALDTTDYSAEWRRMDDIPIPIGVTHGAFAVVEDRYFYLCGGYLGGHPGGSSDICVVYDHAATPDTQWSFLPPLPESRGGGGMVYDVDTNALYFTGGAERLDPEDETGLTDYQHAWKYSFDTDEWTDFPEDIPFPANHMGFVSARDSTGHTRHYFVGGQIGHTAVQSNVDDNYELDPASQVWIPRSPMPFARGHASSSTIPYGCGYLVIAGYTNVRGRTAEVAYYDSDQDHWFRLGSVPAEQTTPVCGTHDGWLICESGWLDKPYSFRRRLVLE